MHKSLLPPTTTRISWPWQPGTATIITTFQSGHGFTTSGADVSSNVNDTTAGAFVMGTQCATVVSAGAGASAILQNTAVTSADTTNSAVAVLVKVDDLTHLSSLNVSFGNGGAFTNEYHIPFAVDGVVTSNQWVWATLSWVDAATLGSPTRTGVNAVRVYHKDDNTGNKVTVHWGAIVLIPNGASVPGNPFPKGVASISFDDGSDTQWNVAKPYLDSKGIRASMFPIKDSLGTAGYMTLAQVKSCQDQSGWDVNAHSFTNADHASRLTGVSLAQAAWDLASNKEWLLANGLDGQGHAYPGGLMNQAVAEQTRRLYRFSRGTQGLTETIPPGDPFRVKAWSAIGSFSGGAPASTFTTATTGKIDQAVTNAAWLNLVFHKIIPPVVSVTMSGNIATIVFGGAHTFSNGASVTLTGFTPAGLNGTFASLTVSNSTTITVNIGSNPGNSTVQGTAVTQSTECGYADFKAIIDKLVSSGITIFPMSEVAIILSQLNPVATTPAAIGSTAAVALSGTAASVGSAATAARSDHVHPRNDWAASDTGWSSWTFDPVAAVSTYTMVGSGTVHVAKVHVPVAGNISNVILQLSGTTPTLLTNTFCGIYQGGTLLATSADQSAGWMASANLKTVALVGAPIAVAAGDIYVAWVTTCTGVFPTITRGAGQASIQGGLAAAASRFGTANTGQTTLPGTLGTIAAVSNSFWAAVS